VFLKNILSLSLGLKHKLSKIRRQPVVGGSACFLLLTGLLLNLLFNPEDGESMFNVLYEKHWLKSYEISHSVEISDTESRASWIDMYYVYVCNTSNRNFY
jgi:hypothetical protein